MESSPNGPVSLVDAVGLYLNSLKKKTHGPKQQHVMRFAQWAGGDRLINELKPSEIDQFGQDTMGSGGGDQAVERLQEVKRFLSFAQKNGLIEVKLAQHLRVPRAGTKSRRAARQDEPDREVLSPSAHRQLLEEVEQKRAQRGPIAQEIRRAAADKDVRENAPLEAAREQLGLVESRIREIERTLESAIVVDPAARGKGSAVRFGSRVELEDMVSGRQVSYTVVSALEANPRESKISGASPVGQALMNKLPGQEVEVSTPRGKQRFKLLQVT